MGERYFTFEIASMTSDNFAYVGKRTTGSEAGSFAMIQLDSINVSKNDIIKS